MPDDQVPVDSPVDEVAARPTPTLGATALLNEVAFVGSNPFVEIKPGLGASGALTLRNEVGDTLEVPAGEGLLLLPLAPEAFLHAAGGSVTLLEGTTELDSITWGGEASFGQGHVRPFLEGDALARTPQSTGQGDGFWYFTANATPGQPNENPTVGPTFPLPGLAVEPGPVDFSWYLLPLATSYRVQIARDSMFSDVLSDQSVEGAFSFPLEEGYYFWRVQPVFPDGSRGNFTRPLSLLVESLVDARAAREKRSAGSRHELAITPLLQRKDTHLILLEAVGTSPTANHAWDRPHPLRHDAEFELDPACSMNCWAASLIMINHFFGGTLSQDRLSYEIYHDRPSGFPPTTYARGPERDFNFGEGLSGFDIVTRKAMTFALGGTGPQHILPDRETFWQVVQAEIEAGRPMIVTFCSDGGSAHDCVISGWIQFPPRPAQGGDPGDDGRAVIVLNPWTAVRETYLVSDLENFRRLAINDSVAILESKGHLNLILSTIPAVPQRVDDEASIYQDTDGDGVTDFDETQRFGTDPTQVDSDLDCIPDKAEILCSLYRGEAGGPPLPGKETFLFYYNTFYSNFAASVRTFNIADLGSVISAAGRTAFGPFGVPLGSTSRDPDGDGLRPELDLNSDLGLLPDFLEDDNVNGFYEPGETSVLVSDDDSLKITGTWERAQDVTVSQTNVSPQILSTMVHSTQNLKVTYDLTVKGTNLTGSVSVQETNTMSHQEEDRSDGSHISVDIIKQPRNWTSTVTLRDFYCNFFEVPNHVHQKLDFQCFNDWSERGGGVPTQVSRHEVDTDPMGGMHVFDRTYTDTYAIFPPVFLDFHNGRMQGNLDTSPGITSTIDLTATH